MLHMNICDWLCAYKCIGILVNRAYLFFQLPELSTVLCNKLPGIIPNTFKVCKMAEKILNFEHNSIFAKGFLYWLINFNWKYYVFFYSIYFHSFLAHNNMYKLSISHKNISTYIVLILLYDKASKPNFLN